MTEKEETTERIVEDEVVVSADVGIQVDLDPPVEPEDDTESNDVVVPEESEESDQADKSDESDVSEEEVPVVKGVRADEVNVGDTVRIHYEIKEGEKSRIQPFDGLVIARKGAGIGKTMMVRHIARGGVGVERIFPVNSPLIKQVDILRKGKVRRSDLY